MLTSQDLARQNDKEREKREKKDFSKKNFQNKNILSPFDELSSLRRKLLEQIIAENDYECAFKIYCNKGLASRISNSIDKDYCKKIIRLLKTNSTLRTNFKKKYFSHILD